MRPNQPDMFDFEPSQHHRRRAMDTSEAAAHSVEHDARALMARILRYLRRYGPATQHEIAAGMRLRHDQVWRRLSDLKNQGYIEDTELRRLGPSKRFQAVWRASDENSTHPDRPRQAQRADRLVQPQQTNSRAIDPGEVPD